MSEHIQIELPGGLIVDDLVYKQARFKPITGYLEAQIAAVSQRNLPALEHIAETLGCVVCLGPDYRSSPDLVQLLCLGDRQYLLLYLARLMGGDEEWFHPQCKQCANVFDIRIQRSKIPVKMSGEGYPFAKINFRGKQIRFRIPNGIDELNIRGKPVDQAVSDLLARCLVPDSDHESADDVMTVLAPEYTEAVEQALDEIAPDVSSQVDTICPECNHRQVVRIDIDGLPAISMMDLYQDTHLMAHSYGWSESQILSLPSWRRRLYIRLIDQTRGVYD